MNALDHIRVVLVEPEHSGNIGAAARAMANMGLRELVLVAPANFPSAEARARASGAEPLERARLVDTLDEALVDCTLVVAASARVRSVAWPQRSPEDAMRALLAGEDRVALVFGRESSGLTNAELDRCQIQTRIPVSESFSSMNLGSAVSVLLYELRRQARSEGAFRSSVARAEEDLASAGDMDHFHEHLALVLDKSAPDQRSVRQTRMLKRIFHRAALRAPELRMLRGVLTLIEAKLDQLEH